MMTNLIQFLHTTAAYQAAALQLMTGQANFTAKQLKLNDPVPLVIEQNTNEWSISPPAMGVGGQVLTSNYVYSFQKGRLTFLKKRDWERQLFPDSPTPSAWTHQPSLIETNGAYKMATNWLTLISVDVGKLEERHPAHVLQHKVPITTTNQNGQVVREQRPVPIFDVFWGEQTVIGASILNPVSVKILGTTPELLQLKIRDGSFYRSHELEVTNASKLLGPLPPPRHFVEKLLGGPAAYETLGSPDKVEAWLLDNGQERSGAKKLNASATKAFSHALLDFDSYEWTAMKLCSPDYGLKLRFTRGKDVVEILFCYNCDILQVSHNDWKKEENFDFAHNVLVKAVKKVFPNDNAIKELELRDEKEARAELEGTLKQLEK